MKQHKSRKLMSAASVLVGLAMTVGGFAPFAFAQTNGDTSTSTSNNTSTSTNATSTNVTNTATTTATTTDNTTNNNNNTGTTTNTTSATTTNSSTSTPVQIMIMKHLCNANIKNMTDFTNLQQGLGQVAAFAKVEANCPTTALPGNNPTANTISAPRTTFDFSVMGPNGATSHIASSTYMNDKVCESDLNVDINNDTNIATSTCLDASDYAFPWIASTTNGTQMVTITETDVPAGYHFGTVLFTPPQLKNNNDANSLVSTSSMNTGEGSIVLNTASDTDRTVMLHVFNFVDTGTSTGTSTATSTNNGGTGTSTATTTTNNGGNNNNGGTSTTTATTTSTTTVGFFNFQLNLARLNAIVNILQRVQDIQSRIVDIVASLASPSWNFGTSTNQ